MADIFISYSRKNTDFARRLIEMLHHSGKNAWVDWEGIPLTSPNWWDEIKHGIASADSFVFIISPHSMASVVCNMELDYAFELGKRIIPLIYQDVDSKEAFASIADFKPDEAMNERLTGKDPLMITRSNWQKLSHINWIFFRESDDFDASYAGFIKAMAVNLDYDRAHTRYLIRAQEWEREAKLEDLLLFGNEIDRAEAWLKQADAYKAKKTDIFNPPALAIHRAYIGHSRRQATKRRWIVSAVGLSIVVLMLFVAIAWLSSREAEQRATIANSQVIEGQVTLGAVNTEVAFAQATVTQVSIINEITTNFADVLLQADHPSQISRLNQLVIQYPNEPLIWHNRALVYASQENYIKAIDDLNQALDINPQYSLAYYNRALVYYNLQDYEQAIIDYTKAINITPHDATIYYNRATVYADLEQYEQAIADYTKAININPLDATAYYNRGVAHRLEQEYKQAIIDFTQSINLDPQHSLVYYNRALVYYNLQDYEHAITDYTKAININYEFIDAYNNRGNAYSALQEYEKAITDYTKAINMNPQFAEAYNNRGNAYSALQEYEKAFNDFNHALNINSQFAGAYYNRGNIYYNLQEYKKAIDDFTQAINLNPQYISSYYNRGNAFAYLQNYEQAIKDFTHIIEINPQHTTAYNNRGNAYYSLHDCEQAITNYEQALAIDPTHSLAQHNLNITLQKCE